MKRILILIIGLIGVAYGQTGKTSAKTQFVNGLYMGTKPTTYFNSADSNALFWRNDSVIMAKYKGTPRPIAFQSYVDSVALERLPIVNVKSYGAVGDGIADDWAAILAASTYAEQNGLTLYFPSGTYNTTGPLTRTASRTDTEVFSVMFGGKVKIVVTDTTNFSSSNRTVFFYATNTRSHSFEMSGGEVEIDGRNFISQAIVATSNVANKSLNINCANLTIKNIFSNGFNNVGSHAIYTSGDYQTMNIKNVIIDSVSRSASLNTTQATQAVLVASQLGKTTIDNVVVKNIGSTSLTQDCDGIVVRGVVVVGDYVGGDFTIQNSYVLNSRGRAIKAQSSNVKVYNTKIEQTDLQTFNSVNSIDFLYGNGIVDGCTFIYGASTLGTSFAPIAFQERVRFIDLVSRATNNTVLTKSQMAQFANVSSTTTTSASANILIENNTILPYDTTITNIITRGLVEFPSNELLALPPSSQWGFTIKNNITYSQFNILTYTGYASGDLSNKIKFDISDNKNYGTGRSVFAEISGSRISNVKKFRLKNNSGWGNYFPFWTVNLTRGALMSDNEFSVDLSGTTFTSSPSGLPALGVALIQVGDSSSQGQMRRVIVADSNFHAYKYANTWVNQPTSINTVFTGTVTNNIIPKSTSSSANILGNSNITDNGSLVTIGSATRINGNIGMGVNNQAEINLINSRTITGASNSFGFYQNAVIQSDVVSYAAYNQTVAATQAASFTLGTLAHYATGGGATFGAGSTVTTQVGFAAGTGLTGATNNYGFRGQIASGTNRWNLFMDGTAPNHMQGSLIIGTTSNIGGALQVTGTTTLTGTATVSSSLTAGSLIRSGGTSSQFLKADGSVDNSTYLTSASITGKLNISDSSAMLSPYRRTTTKITNSDLANSTISGISLGSSLNNLTAGNGLTGTSYNGSVGYIWQVDTTTVNSNDVKTYGTQTVGGTKTFSGNLTTNGMLKGVGFNQPISLKTANYTLTANDHTVIFNTASGNLTATLPAGVEGQIYILRKSAYGVSTNNLIITPNGSETIEGSSGYTIDACSGEGITIQFLGGNWYIINRLFLPSPC